MVRLADGDRAVFHPIFELLWPELRRFARRAMNGAPDAEDAAQSALMKILARAGELDPDRDALTWAIGITAYECRTLRQRARRRREEGGAMDRLAELPTTEDPPEDLVVARDLEDAAIEELGRLGASDAATLRALASGERPAVSAATFRKRVQRALARLRGSWASKHGTP